MTNNVLCTEKTLLGTEFYAEELEPTTFNSQKRTIKIYYKTLCGTVNIIEKMIFSNNQDSDLTIKIVQINVEKYVKIFNMGYEEGLLR